mmetsp:Transcript_12853/g.19243  ORF Transcript_12853/g.19243 Transcript_12853/m.19243 type:complete len:89 (-) Transcript_12853:319-585(-)
MHFSIDKRPTLSRTEAKQVYNQFATTSHAGGKDATSGYGGPAIRQSMDLFISTYCLDLMSETDMHSTLTLAERALKLSDIRKYYLGIS